MSTVCHIFSVSKPKRDSNIKIFVENQQPLKSNQNYVFAQVRSIKCLPPKIGR